jgi:hypothetical protein
MITCAKCGVQVPIHSPGDISFREYLKLHGWTSILIGTDEIWKCGSCGERKS